jgi:hypothetical protein
MPAFSIKIGPTPCLFVRSRSTQSLPIATHPLYQSSNPTEAQLQFRIIPQSPKSVTIFSHPCFQNPGPQFFLYGLITCLFTRPAKYRPAHFRPAPQAVLLSTNHLPSFTLSPFIVAYPPNKTAPYLIARRLIASVIFCCNPVRIMLLFMLRIQFKSYFPISSRCGAVW